MNSKIIEEQAIKLGMVGTLGMAALGIGFALLTRSDAILLDGVFSLINLIVGFFSLQISRLIRQPDNQYYPFGYAIFEPLLNLGKGLLMAIICLFALFSAINSILEGGYPVSAGIAIWYALIAAVGCMAIAVRQRQQAQKSGSPLLEIDAKNWFIDGLMSGAVALSFIIIIFLEKTPLAAFVPYADPTIIILLILAAASVPIEIIKDNWSQIVGRNNNHQLESRIRNIVESIITSETIQDYHLRQGCLGRLVYIQCYLLITKEQEMGFNIVEQDHLRDTLYEALRSEFPYLATDIIFTTNSLWIKRAILPYD